MRLSLFVMSFGRKTTKTVVSSFSRREKERDEATYASSTPS